MRRDGASGDSDGAVRHGALCAAGEAGRETPRRRRLALGAQGSGRPARYCWAE